MANYVSKHTGAQIDAAVDKTGELDGKVAALTEEIGELKENGAGVAVDDSLSKSGKAADAGIVGNLFEVAGAQGKNLNVTKYVDKTSGGVTFTVNGDNSVSLSGTPTTDVWALNGTENRATRFLLPAGTYTLSGSSDYKIGTINQIYGYVCLYVDKETGTTAEMHQDLGKGVTFTTTREYWCAVQIAVMSSAGATDGYTLKMQLEKGEKATAYLSPWAAGVRSARLDRIEDDVDAIEETVFGDAVPEYYFTGNYLPGRVATVKAKMQECVGNGDAFVFHTDAHWSSNAGKSPALLAYISRNLNIRKLISGGDTGNAGGSVEFCEALRRCFHGRVYHVFGNHEYFYPADGSLLAYNTIMDNDDVHTGEPGRNYYYFDNNRAHIRYIVLDSYSPGTADSTGAKEGYEAEQISWLTNIALDVPDGWGVIVFTHHMYYMNLQTMALTPPPTGGQAALDALDAYNANESSKGEVICVVQGHTHHDRITHTTGGIPVIITACDKYKPWIDGDTNNEPWLSTRIEGTITEQAFDIVIVDRKERKLFFYRIGGDAFNGVDNAPGEPVNLRTVTY